MSVAVHRKRPSAAKLLQSYGVLFAFVLLVIVNLIWQPEVALDAEYYRNLLNQNAAVGIIAIGMTLVIIGGGIDLSVGSMMALAASLGVLSLNKLISNGTDPLPATLAAALVSIFVGSVLGSVNGLIITFGRVAPFIATLVGLVVFRSIATHIANAGEIRAQGGQVFEELGRGGIRIPFIGPNGTPILITWPIIVFILIALVAGFLLNYTRYGRHLIAVGANEKAAIYSGINTRAVKLLTYAIIGLFVGIAAIGSAGRMGSVSTSQMGSLYELDAIAAVVIGGTSMSGGRGRIWTTFLGVLLLGLITTMLVTLKRIEIGSFVLDISVYLVGAVKGVIILLAVLIQRGQSD